jgi:SAM-dependent methyltransferase
MDARHARELIAAAVPAGPATWADFGAGDGTFTLALAERLGAGGRVVAVDRDPGALAALVRSTPRRGAEVATLLADLEDALELPGVAIGELDGLLVANALHFLREPATSLARLSRWLRPGGLAVVIEYDRRAPSRWVPHPINASELPALFAAAHLSEPRIAARVDSMYAGEIYVSVGERSRLENPSRSR